MAKEKIKQRERGEMDHFDLMAKSYDVNYGYNDDFTKYKINKKSLRFFKLVKDHYASKSKLNILEIGCGTGAYTRSYAKMFKNAHITAIDISPGMIQVALKNQLPQNVKYQVGSAYKTTFKNNSIDIVCGFYVLHHLDQVNVKREITRVLKKNGLVYFYEPNILNPIVYLIKVIPGLKKRIGDSKGEWAVNPLKIENSWSGYSKIEITTSEFMIPFSFIPYKLKVVFDKLSKIISYIPLINLLGGSVEVSLRKN